MVASTNIGVGLSVSRVPPSVDDFCRPVRPSRRLNILTSPNLGKCVHSDIIILDALVLGNCGASKSLPEIFSTSRKSWILFARDSDRPYHRDHIMHKDFKYYLYGYDPSEISRRGIGPITSYDNVWTQFFRRRFLYGKSFFTAKVFLRRNIFRRLPKLSSAKLKKLV